MIKRKMQKKQTKKKSGSKPNKAQAKENEYEKIK